MVQLEKTVHLPSQHISSLCIFMRWAKKISVVSRNYSYLCRSQRNCNELWMPCSSRMCIIAKGMVQLEKLENYRCNVIYIHAISKKYVKLNKLNKLKNACGKVPHCTRHFCFPKFIPEDHLKISMKLLIL